MTTKKAMRGQDSNTGHAALRDLDWLSHPGCGRQEDAGKPAAPLLAEVRAAMKEGDYVTAVRLAEGGVAVAAADDQLFWRDLADEAKAEGIGQVHAAGTRIKKRFKLGQLSLQACAREMCELLVEATGHDAAAVLLHVPHTLRLADCLYTLLPGGVEAKASQQPTRWHDPSGGPPMFVSPGAAWRAFLEGSTGERPFLYDARNNPGRSTMPHYDVLPDAYFERHKRRGDQFVLQAACVGIASEREASDTDREGWFGTRALVVKTFSFGPPGATVSSYQQAVLREVAGRVGTELLQALGAHEQLLKCEERLRAAGDVLRNVLYDLSEKTWPEARSDWSLSQRLRGCSPVRVARREGQVGLDRQFRNELRRHLRSLAHPPPPLLILNSPQDAKHLALSEEAASVFAAGTRCAVMGADPGPIPVQRWPQPFAVLVLVRDDGVDWDAERLEQQRAEVSARAARAVSEWDATLQASFEQLNALAARLKAPRKPSPPLSARPPSLTGPFKRVATTSV